MPSEDSGKKQLNERQRRVLEEFRAKYERKLRSRAAQLVGPSTRFKNYGQDLVQDVVVTLAKRITVDGLFVDDQGKAIQNILSYAKTILSRSYADLIAGGFSKEDSIDDEQLDRDWLTRTSRRLDILAYEEFFQYERTRNLTDHYRTLLEKLIRRLDDNMQRMVKLRMFDHWEFDEIAAEVRIPSALGKSAPLLLA